MYRLQYGKMYKSELYIYKKWTSRDNLEHFGVYPVTF